MQRYALPVRFAFQPQVLLGPLVKLVRIFALKKTPPMPVTRFTPRLYASAVRVLPALS